MAARSITEIVQKILHLPLNQVEKNLRGELRDYLAHSVARFCLRHNAMRDYDILTQFVQEVIKDLPVCSSPDYPEGGKDLDPK